MRLIAELRSAVTHAHHCVHSITDNSVRITIRRGASCYSTTTVMGESCRPLSPLPVITGADGSSLIELLLDQFLGAQLVFRVGVINRCRDETWKAKRSLHDKHRKQQFPSVRVYLRTD
jgi:hypothetical protein